MSKTRHRLARPTRLRATTLAWDYRDGQDIPGHQHAWHQLVYATTGVMTVQTPEGSFVVPPHRGVWVPGGTWHAIEISGAVSMRTLYLWKGLRGLPRSCQVLNVSPLLRELITHAVRLGTLNRKVAAQRRLMDVILDQLAVVQPRRSSSRSRPGRAPTNWPRSSRTIPVSDGLCVSSPAWWAPGNARSSASSGRRPG